MQTKEALELLAKNSKIKFEQSNLLIPTTCRCGGVFFVNENEFGIVKLCTKCKKQPILLANKTDSE